MAYSAWAGPGLTMLTRILLMKTSLVWPRHCELRVFLSVQRTIWDKLCTAQYHLLYFCCIWSNWVKQTSRVSCVTRASNWYWLTVGQSMLSFQQVWVEGNCLISSVFTFIHFPHSPLSLYFISSTISAISLLPFSGRQHQKTHKDWRVVKPQHNRIICIFF